MTSHASTSPRRTMSVRLARRASARAMQFYGMCRAVLPPLSRYIAITACTAAAAMQHCSGVLMSLCKSSAQTYCSGCTSCPRRRYVSTSKYHSADPLFVWPVAWPAQYAKAILLTVQIPDTDRRRNWTFKLLCNVMVFRTSRCLGCALSRALMSCTAVCSQECALCYIRRSACTSMPHTLLAATECPYLPVPSIKTSQLPRCTRQSS